MWKQNNPTSKSKPLFLLLVIYLDFPVFNLDDFKFLQHTLDIMRF